VLKLQQLIVDFRDDLGWTGLIEALDKLRFWLTNARMGIKFSTANVLSPPQLRSVAAPLTSRCLP